MARSRNIKPAIMANEDLAELQPFDRLLFIYLWMLADREGRLEDRPKRIKAEAFPYDNCDAEPMLERLAAAGFISRYSVEGKGVIQVINFTKHQTPHVREQASTLPKQPPEIAEAEPSTDKADTRHNLGSDKSSPRSPDSLIPDSLNPDSNTPPTPQGEVSAPATVKDSLTVQEPDQEAAPSQAAEQTARQTGKAGKGKPAQAEGFAEFWMAYPRKAAKADAEKAWNKLRPDRTLQAEILASLAKQSRSQDWTKDNGKFIPHPATWLNGRRWLDELSPQPASRHHGFGQIDYREGLKERPDGTFAF